MKKAFSLLAAVSIMLTLMCCADSRRGTEPQSLHFEHQPANAVYHWKTVFNPTIYEKEFMKKHDIRRLYLKFFDVGVDNLYDGRGVQPVPIATTIFKDSIKHLGEVEVVPVVFITVEALRLEQPLAERIVNRVEAMCWAHHIAYREIQLDCDWTRETRPLFFELCTEVRSLLRERRKGLSATIRLHQLRDTLPDIEYGVLMLYNTENLRNPDVKNSILSSNVVKEYMRHVEADKHLDFAYPTYEWTLLFKDRKFKGILRPGDDTNVDCNLRHETSNYHEIIEAKRALRPSLKDIGYPSSNIIYHLDSANLSKYTDHEIAEIYRP
ncbi:MAG: hypothetical protein J5543_06540 [Bacteroidales bacterium]|nr:hypothetical protein [Bacteroidales bacterium]